MPIAIFEQEIINTTVNTLQHEANGWTHEYYFFSPLLLELIIDEYYSRVFLTPIMEPLPWCSSCGWISKNCQHLNSS